MKVKIKAYHALATWKWDLPDDSDDTCGICRVNFEGTCSKCKYPGSDCPIIIGQCTHTFHIHCIANWLESEASLGKCPMCRQKFQEKVAVVAAPPPITPAAAGLAPRRNFGSSIVAPGGAMTPDTAAAMPTTGRITRSAAAAAGRAGAGGGGYSLGRVTPASATRHR